MIKITLLLAVAVLIAVALSGCIQEKKEYVTDPIIADIPLRADLDISIPDSDEPILNIVYALTPQVDVKVNVSEGIILPEEIVFVENNLPTGQITLSKGRTYRYSGTLKVAKPGRWVFYVSPGTYADVNVVGDFVRSAGIQKVWKAKEPLTRFRLRENISEEQIDVLMNITKNWLRRYGAQKYEKEEFNCTIISRPALSIHNITIINIKCYGCELMGYSDSQLHEKYYFIIEEDLLTNKTKVRNVYRWAYWTPSGFESKPVCEEITRTKNVKIGGD